MDNLDLIIIIFFFVCTFLAFSLYHRRVMQVYWWLRKNAPDLYDEAAKGTNHNEYLVIRAVQRSKSINDKLPEQMYKSLRRSERHLVVVLSLMIVTAVFIGAWKFFMLR